MTVMLLLVYSYFYVIVITQDEYDILVESKVKPRMSVNNKDIIRMYLGYNWPITYQSVLSL